MRVMTFKAKPKTIFSIILIVTGIIVIIVSFAANHSEKAQTASGSLNCASTEERLKYIASLGWETDKKENEKQIVIPEEFNDVYTRYNEIQKKQGFDLEKYKGKTAVVYTYNITNYKSSDSVIADLIVCENTLIGADLCDTSAEDGFLTALEEK